MLGFCDTRHIVEHHTSFGLHHEFRLALAELHGLSRATGHVAVTTSQEDQRSNQEQREQQVAQKAEGWRSAPGRMHVETDPFFLKGVDQFRRQTWQVNAEALNAIIQIGIDSFNNCIAATVVNINCCNASRFHVIQKPAVAHPGNGGVAGSHRGAIAATVVLVQTIDPAIANDLPADQQHNAYWQQP